MDLKNAASVAHSLSVSGTVQSSSAFTAVIWLSSDVCDGCFRS